MNNTSSSRRSDQTALRRGGAGGVTTIALCLILGSMSSPARAQAPAAAPPQGSDPQQQAEGGAPAPSAAYPPPPGYQAIPPDGVPGTYPVAPGYPPPPPNYSQPPAGYGTAPPQGGYGPPGPGYQQPGYPVPYPYAPPPPHHEHDGFFLRLHLGFGFTRVTTSGATPGADQEFSGSSVSFGLALGGAVTPNLVLYGAFFISGISERDEKLAGTTVRRAQGTVDVFGLGGGAAYYFQPSNIYLSGTLAPTQFSLGDANDDTRYESRWGLGFQGMVGKEWWVSENWGLGLAGEFVLASMKDRDDSAVTWKAAAFSLLFSASYN